MACKGEPADPAQTSAPHDAQADLADAEVDPGPVRCAETEATTRCVDGWCLIEAGEFTMGSPWDERHRGRNTEDLTQVRYTRPIAMQQTETTQGEWVAAGFPNLAGTQPSDDEGGGRDSVGDRYPAASLGWCEAVEFANRRSRREGRQECMELVRPRGTFGVDFECDDAKPTGPSYYECDGYRLPTAGEWERAARGATSTAFATGPWPEDETLGHECKAVGLLVDLGWFCGNSEKRSHEVCQLPPNGFGLYDMAGNVGEFVAESGRHGYGEGPVTDPPLAVSADMADWRPARGGNFFASPSLMRPASGGVPVMMRGVHARWAGMGFRLVRTLSTEEAANWVKNR